MKLQDLRSQPCRAAVLTATERHTQELLKVLQLPPVQSVTSMFFELSSRLARLGNSSRTTCNSRVVLTFRFRLRRVRLARKAQTCMLLVGYSLSYALEVRRQHCGSGCTTHLHWCYTGITEQCNRGNKRPARGRTKLATEERHVFEQDTFTGL